jgi:hypothetical protein
VRAAARLPPPPPRRALTRARACSRAVWFDTAADASQTTYGPDASLGASVRHAARARIGGAGALRRGRPGGAEQAVAGLSPHEGVGQALRRGPLPS